MIKVSVFYPNGPEVNFDMNYYLETHIPLVAGLLGDAQPRVSPSGYRAIR